MIDIVVRDGRIGRDPALVTADGGEVLHSFQSVEPFNQGDRVTLPDGVQVEVIGLKEELGTNVWRQTLFVGEV